MTAFGLLPHHLCGLALGRLPRDRQLRLHHRRRGLRRLRAGESADGVTAGLKCSSSNTAGSDRSVLIQMPAALSIPMNMKKYNWGYQTEPEPHLGGPPARLSARQGARWDRPRSTVSSTSAVIPWISTAGKRRARAVGAYRHVLPYFKRAEGWRAGADPYRGADGPLATRRGTRRNPLYDAFIEAGEQAGYPVSSDLNGEFPEGLGRFDMTVKNGVRWSAANAYLKPAMKRPNLRVITHARGDASRVRRQTRRRRALRTGGANPRRPRPAKSSSAAAPSTRRNC